ncbi:MULTISPECIES: sensor histidine kinase [unclassified Synechococcus]|uniref:sensor histidine kinase n=1 Tax=unclassified Synechococcus TaxID=2626047 RepID=UPI0039B083E3
MKQQSLPSLRVWLQSTALLTVVAGYALLLLLSSVFADLQRRERHQRLVQSLAPQVHTGRLDSMPLSSFGLKVTLLRSGPTEKPRLQTDASGERWLVSISRLPLSDGEQRWFQLRQNVTQSLERQRMTHLLLIAAAGVSILFTAFLLRPVLRRGLVVPLNDFDNQLQKLEADNLGENLLDPATQPQELRAIALAFNNLQQRLAAAWKRERAFVDGVTHELRTPITVISGYSQRLQRQVLPASAERSAQMISSEARRMSDLLNVMRDLARIDAGKLAIHSEPLDPGEQLLNAYESSLGLAQGRVQLSLPGAEPWPALMADPQKLQQCLQELIRNALLYSSGVVRLQVEPAGDWLVLHVLDQGAGIAAAERSLVLQRFKRGGSSSGTRGMGIGLSLVSELMQLMGGELVIADASGGGADMQLRFRLAVAGP